MLKRDRVTEIWVRGMRSLADVSLPLDGLTVLIGENGSGKSTLIEALEILRRVGEDESFLSRLLRVHDLPSLIRNDASALELGVTVQGGEQRLMYSVALERRASSFVVAREQLDVHTEGYPSPLRTIERTGAGCRFFNQTNSQYEAIEVSPDRLAVRALLAEEGSRRQVSASRLCGALASGAVHLPWEVRARWFCEERGWESPLRQPAVVEPARGLERVGANLVNAFATLKNRDDWQDIVTDVRLGLGTDVRDVLAVAAFRGQHELQVRYASGDVPAAHLSDGTLCYLAFVALVHLAPTSAFLAVDEPELHLDPGLLIRVLDMLDARSTGTPVILATHSDRLLDAIEDPAASVVLCDLDGQRRTRLRRPAPDQLERWLADYADGSKGEYRGLGQMRSEAAISQVMGDPLPPHPAPEDP